MAQYRVTWEIDVEAGTPERAANLALQIQRDSESTATVFDVRMVGPCPSCKRNIAHTLSCRVRRATHDRLIAEPHQIDLGAESGEATHGCKFHFAAPCGNCALCREATRAAGAVDEWPDRSDAEKQREFRQARRPAVSRG